MRAPPREIQLELVAEAGRAPSAHNTQPARWRFLERGSVLLYEVPKRRLAVADPTGRDQRVALGAAFEGMRIALAQRGIGLSEPETVSAGAPVAASPELRLVAKAELRPGASPDPLGEQVMSRRTYRRAFRQASAMERAALRVLLRETAGVRAEWEGEGITMLAGVADRATAARLRDGELRAELIHWLRFTDGDERWSRDGLTADCLGLSVPARWVRRWLFAPRTFAILAGAGLHAVLVAEAPRLRGATALVAVHRPRGEDPLVSGRCLYRFWLALTAAGFVAQPVSVLADDPAAARLLAERLCVPESEALLNVLAIGCAKHETARSPRLPAEELLV